MSDDLRPEPLEVRGRVVVVRVAAPVTAAEAAAAADVAARLLAAGAVAVMVTHPDAWVETFVVACPSCGGEATLDRCDEAGR